MTLIEIEKSQKVIATSVYKTPVWHFTVYNAGEYFDWFGEGSLGRNRTVAGSITVNNTVYKKAENIKNPMDLQQNQFVQIDNIVYYRNENDLPGWVYKTKVNTVTGFTDEKPFIDGDGVYYQSGLDYVPEITDKADSLEYGKMAFKSANIDIINDKGQFDDAEPYFGNNLRIKSAIGGTLKPLYEYYIKNIKIKADKVTMICGDRREKLLQKVPDKRFTLDEFPKIKPELEGEIMQDVYGKCEWVKCVCVDEHDIFDDNDELKTYRTFYVARKITELELNDTRPGIPASEWIKPDFVWVKQTQPSGGEDEDEITWTPDAEVWTPCRIEPSSNLDKGLIVLHTDCCMPSTWEGHDVPEVFEVRACGTFWTPVGKDKTTPLDIIKELLNHYCNILYNGSWFNQEEIESELNDLAPVGIVYDKEQNVYQAIEKLQNASDYGFQFMADYNLFTARKDDNDREPAGAIEFKDIEDISKVEIDFQLENYATIVSVPYSRNYYKDNSSRYEGKTNRENLLYIHGVDKTHEPESYLTSIQDAVNKAIRLEKFFVKNRVMISNVEVKGRENLRMYDIVDTDLRIPIERKRELKQLLSLFSGKEAESVIYGDWREEKVIADFEQKENKEYRLFGGKLKCKVMGTSLDLDTGINTLNLLEVS